MSKIIPQTIEELQAAIKEWPRKKVYYLTDNYEVIPHEGGPRVYSKATKHLIGLFQADKKTLNGKLTDFYIVHQDMNIEDSIFLHPATNIIAATNRMLRLLKESTTNDPEILNKDPRIRRCLWLMRYILSFDHCKDFYDEYTDLKEEYFRHEREKIKENTETYKGYRLRFEFDPLNGWGVNISTSDKGIDTLFSQDMNWTREQVTEEAKNYIDNL